MPAINPGRENTTAGKRKPAAKPKPVPKPKPTGVFAGVKPATAPITDAQKAAAKRTTQAERRLPRPVIAAPPVIKNPTPKQVQAAKTQIAKSITIAIGTAGTGADRNKRRDQLIRQIRTDPKYATVKRSFDHWVAEDRKIAGPQRSGPAKPGPQPRRAKIGVGPFAASINLTATGQAITNAAEKAAPGLTRGSAEARFGKNALSDIAHLPLMVPQTAYEVNRAAWDLAHGDSDRAKAIAKGFTQGVYGLAVQGKWSELEDYVRDHPVYAALELRGGKGVVGRGAGAALRGGIAGKAGRRVASTARKDINLSEGASGARVADRQHYSPDVITKAFQVLAERARGGAGKTAIRDHRLRRRADFESDTAAATSRAVRGDEARKADADAPRRGPVPSVPRNRVAAAVTRPARAAADRVAVARGRRDADVVGLAVQGVIRPHSLEADLHKELARLDHVYETGKFSTGAQRRQNRATANAIQRVLADPAALSHLGGVARSSRANVRAINELQGQAIEMGALDPARAERAKLFPPAQAHLGAEFGTGTRGVSRADAVKSARGAVRSAVSDEAKADAKVAGLTARHRSERGREGYNKPIAAYYVGEHRFELRKDAAAFAKANGIHPREIKRVALTAGEAKRVGDLSQARRARTAARDRRKAAEASLRAAYRTPTPKETLRVQGREVSNQEIRGTLGGEDVAYLPHHTKQRGARAYYQTAFAGRKDAGGSQKRTGAAFEKGAVDVSYEAVKEHRIRMRGVVNRIAEHDKIIHSVAIKGPGGRMMTWDQAEKIASNAADGGAKLVPYRAVPGSYDRARMGAIELAQDAPDGHVERLIGDEFKERLREPAAGDRSARNVVLLPKQFVDQLQQQHAVSGTAGKAANAAVSAFRTVVLPFSTKWLAGNVIEAGARLMAVGAGPNAHRIGKNLLKEIDRLDHDEAIRVKAALTGGLLYGNKGLTVKRLNEHFQGTALEKPAAAVSVAGQLPVVHQLGGLLKTYTDGVFRLNKFIESNAQVAALGKHAKREMQEMTGSWAKATRAQEKALQDLAKGYLDSKNVHDAAKYIDQTLGQYSRFSPPMRRFIQQAAPFLPWYLNAARFVFWTLPAKHPIKTGIYANVAANLQADFDAQHNGLPPGDLRGEVVLDDGTVLPVGRFLPTGAFGSLAGGGDEQLTTFIDPLFPQFKSAALAAFGLNFSGHQAKLPPQDRGDRGGVPGAVRASMALNALAEAFIPAVGIGKRIREGGATGYDNSTILSPKTKPGTQVAGGAANRILNPFRPVSGIKGQPRPGSSSSTAVAAAAPAPDEITAALDAAGTALDNSALDEASAALDVIP